MTGQIVTAPAPYRQRNGALGANVQAKRGMETRRFKQNIGTMFAPWSAARIGGFSSALAGALSTDFRAHDWAAVDGLAGFGAHGRRLQRHSRVRATTTACKCCGPAAP